MESGLELKKKHRSIQFNYRQLGGESATNVKKRVLKFLRRIDGKYKDHEVLIITHGGIIRLLHLLEHGAPQEGEVENVSVVEVDVSKILKNGSLLDKQR